MGEHRSNSFVIAGILLLLWLSLFSGLAQADPDGESYLSGLLSEDLEERRGAAKQLEIGYHQLVSDLLEIAEQTRPTAADRYDSTWVLAVRLLGTLRAREAVPYLVSEIGTLTQSVLDSGALAGYPCARSLVRIGFGDDSALNKLEEQYRMSSPDEKDNLNKIIELISDKGRFVELIKEMEDQELRERERMRKRE